MARRERASVGVVRSAYASCNTLTGQRKTRLSSSWDAAGSATAKRTAAIGTFRTTLDNLAIGGLWCVRFSLSIYGNAQMKRRRLLLATTALVALTPLASPPAGALDLDFGGYFTDFEELSRDRAAEIYAFALQRVAGDYLDTISADNARVLLDLLEAAGTALPEGQGSITVQNAQRLNALGLQAAAADGQLAVWVRDTGSPERRQGNRRRARRPAPPPRDGRADPRHDIPSGRAPARGHQSHPCRHGPCRRGRGRPVGQVTGRRSRRGSGRHGPPPPALSGWAARIRHPGDPQVHPPAPRQRTG